MMEDNNWLRKDTQAAFDKLLQQKLASIMKHLMKCPYCAEGEFIDVPLKEGLHRLLRNCRICQRAYVFTHEISLVTRALKIEGEEAK